MYINVNGVDIGFQEHNLDVGVLLDLNTNALVVLNRVFVSKNGRRSNFTFHVVVGTHLDTRHFIQQLVDEYESQIDHLSTPSMKLELLYPTDPGSLYNYITCGYEEYFK